MFHWICPECGREIAPTAKECPACDPLAASAAASAPEAVEIPAVIEEVPVLMPEIVGLATTTVDAAPVPPVSIPMELPRLMEAVAPVAVEVPRPFEPELVLLPAPVAPKALLFAAEAAAATEPEPEIQVRVEAPAPPTPVNALPTLAGPAPEPESVAPEQVLLPNTPAALPTADLPQAEPVPHAGLREPQPQAPRSSVVDALSTEEAFFRATPVRVPAPRGGFTPAPMFAAFQQNSRISVAAIEPAMGDRLIAGSAPQANISVPGPVLPHELTSLHAAGVARMLWWNATAQAGSQKRGWLVSAAVASGFLALALAAVFYAMPTLAQPSSANSKAEPKQQAAVAPEPPPAPARKSPRELEVTGVRFVTDLPDRGPQIQYIVVNHSNAPLNGVVVNVTLRATASQSPLSQFSFRTPRLGPYESKEMISTIERLNRPLDLPDWREVDAEVEIGK